MTHDSQHPNIRRSAPNALASAWNALCCLFATHPWLWLARSGAIEASPAVGLVLLDALPKLLVALGAGVLSHG